MSCMLRSSAEEVLRMFVIERRRQTEGRSLMARDFDMPPASSPRPPSGYFEQLIRLVTGVEPIAIEMAEMRFLGWTGRPWLQPKIVGNHDGEPVVLWELQADIPSWGAIGRKVGMTAVEVRRVWNEALNVISENLGRARTEGE